MIFPENCTPHVVKWSSNPLFQGSLNAYLDVPRKLADEYTMMSPTLDVMGDTVDGNQKSGEKTSWGW